MSPLLKTDGSLYDLRKLYRRACEIAAARYHVPLVGVIRGSRHKDVVKARQTAISAVHLATRCSYASLGRALGADHTTVRLAWITIGETEEVTTIAMQLDRPERYDDPAWMVIARANGWHPPGVCANRHDEHAGGEL